MICKHIEKRWIKSGYEDWQDGWIDTSGYEEFSAFEDIDLHRMKCKFCKKIEYYSSAAKDFYEKGIKSDIKGLC